MTRSGGFFRGLEVTRGLRGSVLPLNQACIKTGCAIFLTQPTKKPAQIWGGLSHLCRVRGFHAPWLQFRRDRFPIHQLVQKVGQIGGAFVAEVDVIGMFPNITAQQRGLAKAQRIDAVFGLGDLQRSIFVAHKPCPA